MINRPRNTLNSYNNFKQPGCHDPISSWFGDVTHFIFYLYSSTPIILIIVLFCWDQCPTIMPWVSSKPDVYIVAWYEGVPLACNMIEICIFGPGPFLSWLLHLNPKYMVRIFYCTLRGTHTPQWKIKKFLQIRWFIFRCIKNSHHNTS